MSKKNTNHSSLHVLLAHELQSLEHMRSFFLIILGLMFLLHYIFQSKPLQFLALFIINSFDTPSYYHLIATYIVWQIFPFIAVLLTQDAVYRDIEDERIRLTVTKVSRLQYLLGKLLSRLMLLISCILVIALFIMIYSNFKMHDPFIRETILFFVNTSLMVIFVTTVTLGISCFSRNPLFTSVAFLMISLFLTVFDKIRVLSLYSYLGTTISFVGQYALTFFICGSLIAFMTTYYFFRRKML